MRALVTGACGFVGRYLADYLLQQGDTVLGTILHPGASTKFPTKILDITDATAFASIHQEFRPDVVYHLAGLSFVPEVEANFPQALLVNVGAVEALFRSLKVAGQKPKVVFISSAEVYGKVRPEELPLQEHQTLRPANLYSVTKVMAETVVSRFERYDGFETVIMRPFNHIGPGQNDRFVSSSFAKQLAKISRGQSQPKLFVGNLDARRDFSDVRDVVRAYRLAGERGKGIYNIGSGKSVSIRTILDTLISLSGLKVEIESDPERMRPAEVLEIFGSYEKASQELGWQPTISLEETLQSIYQDWIDLETRATEILL